jgi:1-pyrroline-5-carboxylate dehydrogenase
MAHSISQVPYPSNEPILAYAPGSNEKKEVLEMYSQLYHSNMDIPMRIGDQDIRTGDTASMHPPHDHKSSRSRYWNYKRSL